MELSIYNQSGKDTGKKVKLDKSVFGIEPNEHSIYLDVKQHLANKRQGTHKSKERWEVSYSTRKIKRQKGTGTARAGSIKSPLFVGGGRAFGPQPRDYSFKLNKKVKRLARRSALAMKAQNNGIRIMEKLEMSTPKTKDFQAMLNSNEAADKRVLMILPEVDKNIWLSSRNIQKSKVVTADTLNTYDIMNAGVLMMSESSLAKVTEILKG